MGRQEAAENGRDAEKARLEQVVIGGQLTEIREEFVALKFFELVRRQLRLGATVSPAFVPPFL
jgi:hypothetical protein